MFAVGDGCGAVDGRNNWSTNGGEGEMQASRDMEHEPVFRVIQKNKLFSECEIKHDAWMG